MAEKVYWYKPGIKNKLKAHLIVEIGNYPYRHELKEIKNKSYMEKFPALLNLLHSHHPNTLSHTFEDSFIATNIAFDYFVRLGNKLNLSEKDSIDRFMPKVEEVFLGSLLHDIGKTAVPTITIDRNGDLSNREKTILRLHSQLGSDILRRVGLGNFSYFCDEHHIGNSNNANFADTDLKRRHPLTEFVSLADMLSGMRDVRRPYHKAETSEITTILSLIRKKHENGKFSDGLVESFKRVIVEKNNFPPYLDLTVYKKSLLFMDLINKYGLKQVLIKNIQG